LAFAAPKRREVRLPRSDRLDSTLRPPWRAGQDRVHACLSSLPTRSARELVTTQAVVSPTWATAPVPMQPQANGDLLPRCGQKPGKPTDCKPPHACHGVSMAARAGPVGSVPFGAPAGSQKTQARPRHAPSRSTRRRQPPCAPQAARGQTPSGTGLSLANTHRPRPWHCATGDQETWGSQPGRMMVMMTDTGTLNIEVR
jgi:hypothetical protein